MGCFKLIYLTLNCLPFCFDKLSPIAPFSLNIFTTFISGNNKFSIARCILYSSYLISVLYQFMYFYQTMYFYLIYVLHLTAYLQEDTYDCE